MSSQETPVTDHSVTRQNITKRLSSSLRALQMRYVTTDNVITSDDNDASNFLVALEAVFIHGLKVKFIRMNRRRRKEVPLPQPAFWPLLKAVSHRNILSHLESIDYINSDVGRCRSWLRLALNDSLMECYFLTLQREKCRLVEYYQPFALMLDAEDCAIVLSYLQGLSSLVFSLSYKSSILNEWTTSPLTLSGLWLEDTEHTLQYELHRRKSLDSVSQSSASDDTNNSMLSKMQLESSSLSLENSSTSSQLSSSLGSDEQPLTQSLAPPASPQRPVLSRQLAGLGVDMESTPAGSEGTNAGMSGTTSGCPLYYEPIPQILRADEESKGSAETAHIAEDVGDSEPPSLSTLAQSPGTNSLPAQLSDESLSAEESPPAELPKSNSWICEDDLHTVSPVYLVEDSGIGDLAPQLPDLNTPEPPKPTSWISEDDFHTDSPVCAVEDAGIGDLAPQQPDIPTPEPLKPTKAVFHVVHKRQIGLSNPFGGLLMLGTLERKSTLGIYKPYCCKLTPYEFRLCVEGDEQTCVESGFLYRCEAVGPAQTDGRFDLQFPNKRLCLRAPSKDEAQDWVDRIQEAVQKCRPSQDDTWEILECPYSPNGESSCRAFDWTFQAEVEPDALKESIVYMKVQKLWLRLVLSLSQQELKCFVSHSGVKTLFNVYTADMIKDILPDSSLGGPSCFRVVTTKGPLQLQAECAAEAKAWRELVRAVFLELEEDSALILRAASLQMKPHIRSHPLFQHLLHIPIERGLDTQNFKCASCHKQIGLHFGKVHVCWYTGLYYCSVCHKGDMSVIPSRIVHNWDLTERPVSRQAMNFLTMVQDEPIFNLKLLNESLYEHTVTMGEIRHSREKLRLLAEYLMSCRSGALQELSTSLDQRDYFLDCAHTYSMQDLIQISKGALQFWLQFALDSASSHVYTCDLCSQRGFFCQICNQDEILYPFQFDTTTRCGDCKAVFHKPCKLPTTQCPRCERRRKCQDQRAGM